MTLTEFLLARISEDDAAVDGAYQGEEIGYPMDDLTRVFVRKVDRDVVAKRRIVEAAAAAFTNEGLQYALRCMALSYADHPDYRYEWRP